MITDGTDMIQHPSATGYPAMRASSTSARTPPQQQSQHRHRNNDNSTDHHHSHSTRNSNTKHKEPDNRKKKSIFNLMKRRSSKKFDNNDGRNSAGNKLNLDKHLTSRLKVKSKDVKMIMEMGFSKDQAVWALVENDNNVLQAINSLTR